MLNSILQYKSSKFHKQPKQQWRHTSLFLGCWLSVFVHKSWRNIWWPLQTINLPWRLQLWRRANLVQAGGKEEWDLSDKKQVTTTSFMESDDLGIMDSGSFFKRKGKNPLPLKHSGQKYLIWKYLWVKPYSWDKEIPFNNCTNSDTSSTSSAKEVKTISLFFKIIWYHYEHSAQ